jgi:hypothetical protein
LHSPKLPCIVQKKKRSRKKKTNTPNPKHKEKIKRKGLLEELDADDDRKKNRKDPPEKIEERNFNAINPPADMKSKSKSNDGYSNDGVNAILSLPFLADEVDDKEPKCQAFVAINYSLKIGGIGT